MKANKRKTVSSPLLKTAFESLIVGWTATQALDWISVVLYENESPQEREKENAARGKMAAYEVGLQNLVQPLGIQLSREELAKWSWRFHKTVGIGSGLIYGMLRRRYPKLGLGNGLVFGSLFFLLIDELVVPLAQLSPGPRAFSWKVHARGAAAHLGYGVAAESLVRVIERVEGAEKSAA